MISKTIQTVSTTPALLAPELGENHPWYALRVRSNFEKVTSISLRQRGYEEYLPAYKSLRRRSNRLLEIEQPLFPGYLFCRLNVQDRLPVLTTPGVVHIVGLGKTLIPVADAEITAIQKVVRAGVLASPWPFLRTGQRVLIERGPLSGIEGILVEVKTGYRLVVSITLLQRSVAAEIDRDWVRPIHSNRQVEIASPTRC